MKEEKANALRKRIATVIILFAAIFLIVVGIRFVVHRMRYAVTDAVFVRTDTMVNLGFDRVQGRIIQMTKSEGDPVKKGEVLAILDKRSYEHRLEGLREEKASLEKEREGLELALIRLTSTLSLKYQMAHDSVEEILRKKASLEAKRGALQKEAFELERDLRRYTALVKEDAVSKKRFEAVETRFNVKQKEIKSISMEIESLSASLKKARKGVKLAASELKRIDETKKELASIDHKIKGIEAQIEDVQKDLTECTLKSPINGIVAKKFVSTGDVVSPKRVIYALLDPKKIYVLVLLEEGKLHGVAKGCKARVKIDAYPDEEFNGEVETVYPASAATFALIPRDVSAGEFTKVAQRIPVKIRILQGPVSLLRVGLGGEVEIRRR